MSAMLVTLGYARSHFPIQGASGARVFAITTMAHADDFLHHRPQVHELVDARLIMRAV